ncbi:MAG: hypothetical protein OEY87_04740 [Gammaproteobacteria bacterium]|nr:hypothetical protein [Gammaproteobacteria bacterium]MDH5735413.1 hypothetical protein [Gammaproteobacteria bacterium]
MKIYFLLLAVLLVSACSNDVSHQAVVDVDVVVATRAPDYSSGAYSVINELAANSFMATNELAPTSSDVFVAAYGAHYYFFNKTDASVTKYSYTDATTPVWQFSVNDAADTGANPYAMIFVNETKAYILRYGKATAWIVNPSATIESDFKTGELDLTAYDDGDGIPEMANGIIVGNKLFITMQRLDRNNFWSHTNIVYVAVFDVTTDQEIDTNYPGDAVMGIPMEIINPNTDIAYDAVLNKVFVQGQGDYFGGNYTGGIESIDPDTYNTLLELDDGDQITHDYGFISGLAISSATRGYFVSYVGWGDNYLYTYNPATGAIQLSTVTAVQGINIASIAFDANGRLWVADATNATVHIIDAVNDTLIDSVSTVLSPINMAFAQ